MVGYSIRCGNRCYSCIIEAFDNSSSPLVSGGWLLVDGNWLVTLTAVGWLFTSGINWCNRFNNWLVNYRVRELLLSNTLVSIICCCLPESRGSCATLSEFLELSEFADGVFMEVWKYSCKWFAIMTLVPEVSNKHLFRCERSLLTVNERSCSTKAVDTSVALDTVPSLSALEAEFRVCLVTIVGLLRHNGIMLIELHKR